MDTTRTGGSNGLPTFSNNNILKLLKSESTFIRKGKGVKLVKTAKKWKCYYISAGGKKKSQHVIDRKVSMWEIPQPRLGGQFDMTNEYFEEYYMLIRHMTEAKYNSALLLEVIGPKINIDIQSGAVSAAKKEIVLCNNLLSQKKHNYNEKKLVKMLTFGNRFSLVAYPVAYHFDVFIGQCQSLENKICLSFDKNEFDGSIGRGGDGSKKFVFALLDHNDSAHRRRRGRYVAAGGNLTSGQRLTEEMWIQQFGNSNGFKIDN